MEDHASHAFLLGAHHEHVGLTNQGVGFGDIPQEMDTVAEAMGRDLPLHGGHVPKWLSDRMTALGRVLCEAIVLEYGTDELLRRLAHPYWFQSLGCVMGMDWHSSGITTSVMGALKRGLNPRAGELGIHICGGRGRHSRRTPDELRELAGRLSLDGESLVRTSRLTARIDNNAIADGFQIYLHTFVLTREGALDAMTVDVELAPGVSLSNAERDRKAQAVVHHIKSLIGVTCEVVIKAEGEVPRSQGKAVRVKDERGR